MEEVFKIAVVAPARMRFGRLMNAVEDLKRGIRARHGGVEVGADIVAITDPAVSLFEYISFVERSGKMHHECIGRLIIEGVRNICAGVNGCREVFVLDVIDSGMVHVQDALRSMMHAIFCEDSLIEQASLQLIERELVLATNGPRLKRVWVRTTDANLNPLADQVTKDPESMGCFALPGIEEQIGIGGWQARVIVEDMLANMRRNPGVRPALVMTPSEACSYRHEAMGESWSHPANLIRMNEMHERAFDMLRGSGLRMQDDVPGYVASQRGDGTLFIDLSTTLDQVAPVKAVTL